MNPKFRLPQWIKLREKLVVTILVLGLLPLLIASVLNVTAATSALTRQAFSQLESVRALKTVQIEDYFEQIRGQIGILAKDPFMVEAMLGFADAFHAIPERLELEEAEIQERTTALERFYTRDFASAYQTRTGEQTDVDSLIPQQADTLLAQYLYIAENPNAIDAKRELDAASDRTPYTRLHRRYHPFLRDYMDEFGFQDILMVEAGTGQIVYSVLKGIDFGTSLINGPFSRANIARAFASAANAEEGTIADFERYLPTFDAPASFIATPVLDRGNLIGVLIFKMPIGVINGIMTERSGMGETGESYLVGGDGLMRSQSRSSSTDSILVTPVDTVAIQQASTGVSGSATIDDYRGVRVLSAWAPLDIAGLDWMIVAEQHEAEVEGGSAPLIRNAVLISAAAIAAIIVGALFFARLLVNPINSAANVAKRIAEGKLDNSIRTDSSDETGAMLSALSRMQNELRERIERDKEYARRMMRVTEALDTVSSGILITDDKNDIVFANAALAAMLRDAKASAGSSHESLDPEKLVGRNITDFRDAGYDIGSFFKATTSPLTSRIGVGAAEVEMTVHPMVGEDQRRTGAVIEWRDMTAEHRIEGEIEKLIESARAGDLTARVDATGKQGFFEVLCNGINSLVEISQHVIQDVGTVLSALAKGDLTKRISGDYSGAYGELKSNTQATVSKLTEIVSEIQASADRVGSAAVDISAANENVTTIMADQAVSVKETNNAMADVASTVQRNADDAVKAYELAEQASNLATSGGEVVRAAIQAMGEIDASSKKIADIIGVVDEIAFQTNLLALNASVEAARAGQQGRGFAVVAAEVRTLAGRSASAAREIKELIHDSVGKVKEGSRLVNESGVTLDGIVQGTRQVTDLVAQISGESREQSGRVGVVSGAIARIDDATRQNSKIVERAAAAASDMRDQSESLLAMLEFFSLMEEPSAEAAYARPTGSSFQDEFDDDFTNEEASAGRRTA